jgi:preprotein translocase subunit SecF
MKNWYDKSYKFLLIIPAVILIFSLVYLAGFYSKNGDIIDKDVSLTGGTTITVLDEEIDVEVLKDDLSEEFLDLSVRSISDFRTGQQKGFILETAASAEEIKDSLEDYLGYELTQENSSVEFTGSALSSGFYQQLRGSIIAAFLLMAWVVFLIFSESPKIKAATTMITFLGISVVLPEVSTIKFISGAFLFLGLIYGLIKKGKKKENRLFYGAAIASLALFFIYPASILILPIVLVLIAFYALFSIPSLAVILSAFADITMTIAFVDIIGMKLSIAGVIAFLMLIGYSVDTDILLTSRLIKRKEGKTNERMFGAFKTGITMTLTSIAAIGVSLLIIYSFSDTLRQIFTILIIGLSFDLLNTWLSNASIMKWYVERKEAKER